jgi:hypothetical protein
LDLRVVPRTSCRHAQGLANRSPHELAPGRSGAKDFALLEPRLELVELVRRQVLDELSNPIRHIYFPHQAVVSLVNVMDNAAPSR